MILDIQKSLAEFNQEKVLRTLPGIRRGFEKECLRVDALGHIAMSSHPSTLGSNLTHPMITTDYSEALLEFITPPMSRVIDLFSNLLELHQYTIASLNKINKEFLWAFSMPCHLPENDADIPIARYGDSNLGLLKYYYRVGLGHRYGKRMQMIAGVHYNFSFSTEFFKVWQAIVGSKQSEADFISESYLGMIRNALRLSWTIPLLFGASPAIVSGFINDKILKNTNHSFMSLKDDTLFLPYATSLRLSDMGYHNKAKPLVAISYNHFSEFIQSLELAVHTKDPEFAKIGIKVDGVYRQLSDGVLQVEDEHYALLRAKRMTGPGERMLPALAKQGIEYIELRALDLDPFSPLGIAPEAVYFLDVFLVLCLLLESKELTKEERDRIAKNNQRVAIEGRKPGLKLLAGDGEEVLMSDSIHDILSTMERVADCLDSAYSGNEFTEAVRKAKGLLSNFNELPSAKILFEMQERQESYCEFASRYSHLHEQAIRAIAFDKERFNFYRKLAEDSLQEQKTLEQNNLLSFDDYLHQFLKA